MIDYLIAALPYWAVISGVVFLIICQIERFIHKYPPQAWGKMEYLSATFISVVFPLGALVIVYDLWDYLENRYE